VEFAVTQALNAAVEEKGDELNCDALHIVGSEYIAWH
jgi:hypothetical protein